MKGFKSYSLSRQKYKHADRHDWKDTYPHSRVVITRMFPLVTSTCCPGWRTFPHSSHRKHSLCQSLPNDVLLSAKNSSIFFSLEMEETNGLNENKRSTGIVMFRRIYTYGMFFFSWNYSHWEPLYFEACYDNINLLHKNVTSAAW